MATVTSTDNKGLIYDSFIFSLSLLAVANLCISLLLFFQPDIVNVVVIMNLFLSVVFFGDFLYRLFSSDGKWQYLIRYGGWADLISSVPFPGMKIFRLYRIAITGKGLYQFRAEKMADELSAKRAEGALYVIILWIILIIEIGSILILHVERLADHASILSAMDAIWWSFVTITTVGYGDLYPVTYAGRFIAIILMISGVGVFGTLAGFLSTKLVSPRKQTDKPSGETPGTYEQKIDILLARLDAQQELTAALLQRLEQYEMSSGSGMVET
ncbi:potassium channel family protein [Methanogenium marinum]|uniref:Potassium channel family protein n=1 Tax=Methanogenium marinum TaxID=348610 RepID=A0A9Q4KSS4_9EURY|nr:potassium channel family protein [Methanogenium marinum]MDE4907951.1 potassium channel family protein [Methanogenium marinum]